MNSLHFHEELACLAAVKRFVGRSWGDVHHRASDNLPVRWHREFMLGNYRYCCPLTVTDFASRYLLRCEASFTSGKIRLRVGARAVRA
jgi:hypothetical protein